MVTNPTQEISFQLHIPSAGERMFFLLQGVLISTPSTIFFESVALTYLSAYLAPNLSSLLIIVVLAPIIEEFTKAFPLLYRHAETERSIFTLGFLTGLGFGFPEFIFYVSSGAPITLRILGIFFHAASTSISAYGLAKRNFLPYFAISVFLHASNNLFAQNEQIWWLGGGASILACYLLSWRFYGNTRNQFFETSPEIRSPVVTVSNPEKP